MLCAEFSNIQGNRGKRKKYCRAAETRKCGGTSSFVSLWWWAAGTNYSSGSLSLQHSMLGMRDCTTSGWVKIWNFLCHRHCPVPKPCLGRSVPVLLYYQCLPFHYELHQISVISTKEPPLGLFSPPSSPCLPLFFLAEESMEKASHSSLKLPNKKDRGRKKRILREKKKKQQKIFH